MKIRYIIIAIIIQIILIMPGCTENSQNPGVTENQGGIQMSESHSAIDTSTAPAVPAEIYGTLYIFDLKTFLSKMPTSVAEYDYFKLATALQGLVNRGKPQIYFIYENTTFNNQYDFEVDKFWLEQLSADGRFLSHYAKDYDAYPPTPDGFFKLMSDFSDYYDGFVLWDHNVPATANAASTASGVQNLLPVRYCPNDLFSLYSDLFISESARYNISDIKLNLVGKFTGDPGNIWDTDIPSTGSAKNDAYLWAKTKYLDAGLTNPLRMAYCTDAWVKPVNSQSDDNDVEFVSVNLPEIMYPGQSLTVRITVRNKTDSVWREDGEIGVGYYRLGTIDGNNFDISNQKNGGYTDQGNARIFIGGTVGPDEIYTFEFDITAPNEPGYARLTLQMVQDGVRWMTGSYVKVIEITEQAPKNISEMPEEKPAAISGEVSYPAMFWTTLANADYHIAQKAFFWDLSPDDKIAPIDDRGQKTGEDVRTLNALLLSQARQSGFNIFNVSGFVPWNFKYTTTSDPDVSKMGDVDSEWTMINRISSHGGQTEADANAGVGDISNCSVFMHVPLNSEFKQSNDKGRDNALVYDPDTHYIMIYMGDYDSASWTSSILSMLWENSKNDRGKYPLCWPIATGISGRIPQLFNYIYENATPNDFFIAGDNGTAYLNSSMFEPELRPEGMPDMLDTWEKYNIEYNKRFDIDVLGLHINMSQSTLSNTTLSQRLRESIARMTPVGASAQTEKGYPGYHTLVDNPSNGAVTPFINYWDIGGAGTSAQQIAQNIYNIINSSNGIQKNQRYHNLRCILIPPDVINEALDLLASGEIGNPKYLNYEVVDPYTLYRMAGQVYGK